jgi:hypothetical protein
MAPLINDFDVTTDDLDYYSSEPKAAPLHAEATAQSPSAEPQQTQQRRHVSFDETVIVRIVINRDEFTTEETKASWYDRQDLRQMRDGAKADARLVESGVLVEGDDCSIRGVESRTANGIRAKRQSRMNAYAAVFFEMDSQECMNVYDEDAIADAYFSCSEPCLMTAHMIGVRDAEIAKAIQGEKPEQLFGASLLLDFSTPESNRLIYSLAA